MKVRISLGCVDGKTYYSDQDKATADQVEKIRQFCKDVKNIDSLSIVIGGRDHYFHPDNVVWIDVETFE